MMVDDFSGPPSPVEPDRRADRLPLIPTDYSSQEEALENFTRVYEARYGDYHPLFYPAPFEATINDALHVKPSQRKPLLIYLQDDSSVLANIFVERVLDTAAVTEFLNQNFLVWAWDCTEPENKNKFILMLSNTLGSDIAYTVRSTEPNSFPVLLVVGKSRGTVEVLNTIKEMHTIEELMPALLTSLDLWNERNQLDAADEVEREARELMRSEQEEAYRASLAADRLKQEQKRQEEQRVAEAERLEKREAAKREEEQQKLANELPPEPAPSARVVAIRFRLPTNEVLERRFLFTERLSTLLKYAASKGYKPAEYSLFTSYPKRDLTNMDDSRTLRDLQFSPRETVVVEQK